MMPIAVFAAGVAYALLLWQIAAAVARRRALAFAACPVWVPAVCGSAALGATALAPNGMALPAAASLIGAIVCGVVDARTGRIFDALSLTVGTAAAGAAAVAHRLGSGALGAIVVGGALALLYALTRRRGIGLGDVKLGSAIALGFGLEAGITAIGSAFVLGAVYAVGLLATGRARRTDAVRFGPFIAGGAAVGLVIGSRGWSW